MAKTEQTMAEFIGEERLKQPAFATSELYPIDFERQSLEQDYKLESTRQSKTLMEKMYAATLDWEDITAVGGGFKAIKKTVDSNFIKDSSYVKRDIRTVNQMVMDIGGTTDDVIALTTRPVNEEHFQSLYIDIIKENNKQRIINESLSSSERNNYQMFYANADYDVLFSLGVVAAPKLAVRAFGTVGRIAGASAGLGFSKPFVRDYFQEQDGSFSDLLLEGTISAVIEGLSVKYMSPELKQAVTELREVLPPTHIATSVTEQMGETVDNVVFNGTFREPKVVEPQPSARGLGTSAEDKLINEFTTTSVDDIALATKTDLEYATVLKDELSAKLDTSSELLKKDEQFMKHMNNKDYESALSRADELSEQASTSGIKMPKPKELDEIAEVVTMIEDDLIKTLGSKFDADEFGAELHVYSQSAKQFNSFMDGLSTYIAKNIGDAQRITKVVGEMKKAVDDIFKDMSSFLKISAKQKELYKNFFKSQVDTFISNAQNGIKVAKSELKELDDMIKDVTSSTEKMKPYISKEVSQNISNIEKQINRIKDEIAVIKQMGEEAGQKTSKNKAVIAKTKEMNILEKDMAKIVSVEKERIAKELKDELGNGIPLTRNGYHFTLGNKKLAVGLTLGTLGSTGAFAQSDGDAVVSTLSSLFLLAGAGGIAFSLFRSGAIGRQVGSMFSKTVDNVGNVKKTFDGHRKLLNALRDDMMFLRSGWNETFAPVKKYAIKSGNERLKQYVDNTLFNGTQGSQVLAESTKSHIIHSIIPKYQTAFVETYDEWVKANEISMGSRLADYFSGQSAEYTFKKYVSFAEAGLDDLIPEVGKESVMKMAKASKDLKDEVFKSAKELGVDGTDEVQKLEKYLTRRHNSNIRSFILGMKRTDTEAFKEFRQMFIDMHVSAIMKLKPKTDGLKSSLAKVVDGLTDLTKVKEFASKNRSIIDEVVGADDELSDLFAKFENADTIENAKSAYVDFANAIDEANLVARAGTKIDNYIDNLANNAYGNEIADIMSPLKKRIPLDLTKFRTIRANIDGDQMDLAIDTIFDMDNFSLFEKYVNAFAGRIGLKNAGFQVADVYGKGGIIDSIVDTQVQQVVKNYTDMLLGKPITAGELTNRQMAVMQGLMNISSARLLTTSPVSLIMEGTWLVARSIFNPKEGAKLAQDLFSYMKETGKDSCVMSLFAHNMGFAVGSKMGKANIRGEALDLFDADVASNRVINVTKNYRDTIMNTKGTGISWWSDQIELANVSVNTQRLSDIARGHTKIGKTLMEKYGITEADFDWIKQTIEINEQGFVKYPDTTKLSLNDRLRLNNILFNMNQYGAQRSTLGGTPHWAYASTIGSGFIKLLSYSINSVSNLGAPMIKGAVNGDPNAFIAMSGLTLGGYLSARARDAVMGREEKEDEQYWKYAVMSLPMFAPVGMMSSIANPTVPAGIDRVAGDFANTATFMFGR